MRKFLFVCLFICSSVFAQSDREKVFTKFYEEGPWDENGFVFSGAQIEITREYVDFLQDFMKKNNIQSVVDVGCGDWAFSRYIDWSGVEYKGIDIVKLVIDRNQRLFAKSSITFIHGDALEMDLPEADLLICKDVLQHLPNADVLRLLKQLHKFKHCLFTDYVDPITLSSYNRDIVCGWLRFIDLTKPPFNLKGEKVFIFVAYSPKQTLYIRNQTPSPQ